MRAIDLVGATHVGFIEAATVGDPDVLLALGEAGHHEKIRRFGQLRRAEQAVFPDRDRIALRPIAVDGLLPRTTASQTKKRWATGTLQVRLSKHANLVASLSAGAWAPLARVEPSSVRTWAELVADTGALVVDRAFDIDQLPELAYEATRPTDELDRGSIRLRDAVGTLGLALLDAGLRRGPGVRAVVIRCDVGDEGDDGDSFAVDVLPTGRIEVDDIHDIALLIRAGRRSRSGSSYEMGDVLSLVQAALDHIACHVWILSEAEQSLRRQANGIERLGGVSSGGARSEVFLREVWKERSWYLRTLEGRWSLGARLPTEVRELVNQIDGLAGLSTSWARCERRLLTSGDAFTSYLSIPRIDPAPPLPPRDQEARKILNETNPLRQFGLLLGYWRKHETRRSPVRRIELHPFSNRDPLFQELHASLTVTTLMTATAGIILGIILQNRLQGAQPATLGTFVRPIDIVFMFVATFAFFFSTMVCANAAAQLSRRSTSGIERQIDAANSVAEFLGKYPFLIGLPMAVVRYVSPQGARLPNSTERYIVSAVVVVLAVAVLAIYNRSEGIALLHRDLRDERFGSNRLRSVVTIGIPLFALVLLLGALRHPWLPIPFGVQLAAAVVLFVLFASLALISALLPGKTDDVYFEVDEWDAMGAEAGSWTDWRKTEMGTQSDWRRVQEEQAARRF